MQFLLLCAIVHNCGLPIKILDRHMKSHDQINTRNQAEHRFEPRNSWPFSFPSPNKDNASNFNDEIDLVEGTNSSKPVVIVYDGIEPLPVQIEVFPKKGSDEKKGNGIITYNAHQQATNQTEDNGDIMIANVTKESRQLSDQVDPSFPDHRGNLTSSLPKDNKPNHRNSKIEVPNHSNNTLSTILANIALKLLIL